MANPPITIGPFTNVPAPGSPIRSDWPQQITTRYVASEVAFEGDVAGGEGLSVGTNANYLTFTFTAPWAGLYLVMVSAYFSMTAAGSSDVTFFAGVDGLGVNTRGAGTRLTNAGAGVTLTDFGLAGLNAGPRAVQAIARCTVGGVLIGARTATVVGIRQT